MSSNDGPPSAGHVRRQRFDVIQESWDEYRMGDVQVRLRFIPTVMGFRCDEQGTPTRNEDGTPQVEIAGQLIVTTAIEEPGT